LVSQTEAASPRIMSLTTNSAPFYEDSTRGVQFWQDPRESRLSSDLAFGRGLGVIQFSCHSVNSGFGIGASSALHVIPFHHSSSLESLGWTPCLRVLIKCGHYVALGCLAYPLSNPCGSIESGVVLLHPLAELQICLGFQVGVLAGSVLTLMRFGVNCIGTLIDQRLGKWPL
jgi:hypothetical protein